MFAFFVYKSCVKVIYSTKKTDRQIPLYTKSAPCFLKPRKNMKNQAIFNFYTTFATTLANMMYPFIECHILDYENPEAPTCHSYFKNKKTTVTGHEAIPSILHKSKIQEKLPNFLGEISFEEKI